MQEMIETTKMSTRGQIIVPKDIRDYINNHATLSGIGTIAAASIFLAVASISNTLNGISPLQYYKNYFSNQKQTEIAQPIKPKDKTIKKIVALSNISRRLV